MRRVAATVHQYLLWLWLIGVVLAAFLAGFGLFETTRTSKLSDNKTTKLVEANNLNAHRALGSLLILVTLLVLIAALVARTSRRQIGMSAAFFVLAVVQMFLAGAGASSGAFWGGLHVVNAFLLTGLAIGLVIDDRRSLGSIRTGPAPEAI